MSAGSLCPCRDVYFPGRFLTFPDLLYTESLAAFHVVLAEFIQYIKTSPVKTLWTCLKNTERTERIFFFR